MNSKNIQINKNNKNNAYKLKEKSKTI